MIKGLHDYYRRNYNRLSRSEQIEAKKELENALKFMKNNLKK